MTGRTVCVKGYTYVRCGKTVRVKAHRRKVKPRKRRKPRKKKWTYLK